MNPSNSISKSYRTTSGVSISPYPTVIKSESSSYSALNPVNESSLSTGDPSLNTDDLMVIHDLAKRSEEALISEWNSGGQEEEQQFSSVANSDSMSHSTLVSLPSFDGSPDESVTRMLNDRFGFDGWTCEVRELNPSLVDKTAKDQWHVVYQAKVRCIHVATGTYKDDIGIAESIHKQRKDAVIHAMKAAVSDGLKRAARHLSTDDEPCVSDSMSPSCYVPLQTFYGAQLVRNPDGTPLLDQRNKPIPIAKMLATKPLRGDIQSRQGPGKSKVSYLSTDSVSRALNDIFGFDGWASEVRELNRVHMEKTPKGQWLVTYQATVRCIHRASGASKEDVGVADSINGQIQDAISNAIKAAVSDGLKRAARHLGDKLGNVLYNEKFKAASAPVTLQEALDQYDIERAQTKFGFEKDRPSNSAVIISTSSGSLSNHTEPLNQTPATVTAPSKLHDPASVTAQTNPSITNRMSLNPAVPPKSSLKSTSTSLPGPTNAREIPSSSSTNRLGEPSLQYGTPAIHNLEVATAGMDPTVTSIANHNDSNGISRFQNKTIHSSNAQNVYPRDVPDSVDEMQAPSAPVPPPPFANRSRPDVLHDISGSLNSTSHMNIYSKRKLDLSNDESFPNKVAAINPYSKK